MKLNLKNVAVSLVSGVLLSSLVACTPPKGGTADSTTSTQWKEGYGGNMIALEAMHMIEDLCLASKNLRPEALKASLKTSKDVSDEICGLLAPGALMIKPVDQPMVNGEKTDFANYPNSAPRGLEIKESFWSTRMPGQKAEVEDLMRHEIVRLIGIPDGDLSKSRLLRIALQSRESDTVSVYPLCETDRIYAELAGASVKRAASLGVWYGRIPCQPAFEVIRSSIGSNLFEPVVHEHLQQGYILGLVTGFMLTPQPVLANRYLAMFGEAVHTLPQTFERWAWQDWIAHEAKRIGAKMAPQTCDNLLCFLAGADTTIKRSIVGYARPTSYFDRGAAALLKVISSDPATRGFLVENFRVKPRLVQASIQAGNWPQLNALGVIQKIVDPSGIPSDKLLADVNWDEMQAKITKKNLEDIEAGERPCRVPRFEWFVRAVVDDQTAPLCPSF